MWEALSKVLFHSKLLSDLSTILALRELLLTKLLERRSSHAFLSFVF
jgi:hypothetical protein